MTRAPKKSFAELLSWDPFLEHDSADLVEVGMAGETAADKAADIVVLVVGAGSLG